MAEDNQISEPITTTNLRQLIAFTMPRSEGVHLTAFFMRHGDAWMIQQLTVNPPDGKKRIRVMLPPDASGITPLLTQTKKEKRYKTMDALYRDMKAIAGEDSRIILWEVN